MQERLDIALARRGLAPSRSKARAAVEAGLVLVNGRPAAKPSQPVDDADELQVMEGAELRYVGRGGLKLERALEAFGLDARGLSCVDLGASTGGFTDCLLQHGAARVVAVDVGRGQLHPSLARDPRVVSLEGTDARSLVAAEAGGPFDLAVADLSFIPLERVLPHVPGLLKDGASAVCLVKPQFEAGPGRAGKRGVVRDPAVRRRAVEGAAEAARACGMEVLGVERSPILGGDGNEEYLMWARKGRGPSGAGAFQTPPLWE